MDIHVYIPTYMYIHVCIYTHVCMCVYMYTHTCVCVCVYGLNLVPDQSQATTRVPNDSLVYCVRSFLTISLYIERFCVPTLCVFLPADYV